MSLVPEDAFPVVQPEADWMRDAFGRRRAVLDAIQRAYETHDAAIHMDDEMWNGLVTGGSHVGPAARWARLHYMYGGRSALRSIGNALMAADAPMPARILDFPCGHGRVTRFLRAAFPAATIYAGDLNTGGIRFCAERFGAIPVQSQVDLTQVELPTELDLVWCGSLITHLPEEECLTVCRRLVDSLAPGGIAGITVCSRGMAWAQQNLFPTIDDDRFAGIAEAVRDQGFGYADYPGAAAYGMTFVDLRWVRKVVESRTDACLLSYAEKGWHDSQDVVWLIKRPLSAWYHWGQD